MSQKSEIKNISSVLKSVNKPGRYIGGEYNSADYPGFLCKTIEDALPGTNCVFLQAPEGDVNHVNTNPTPGEAAISEIDFDKEFS